MSQKLILICDDEVELAAELAEWFALSGWETITASSSPEARHILSIGPPPDVLLSDRRMPLEDGDALLTFALDLPEARCPRVTALMSGDARLDTKPCPTGVNFVFLKPVDPDQLHDAFVKALAAPEVRASGHFQG